MPKRPRDCSPEWYRKAEENPLYIENTIKDLNREAAQGSKVAADLLLKQIEKFPAYKSLVPMLDDLITRVEKEWMSILSGDDPIRQKAFRDEIAALKAELLPSSSTLLQKALANCIVVSYLAFQHAAMLAAAYGSSPSMIVAREKRLSLAQKRLLNAIKIWELIRGKKLEWSGIAAVTCEAERSASAVVDSPEKIPAA